MMDPSLERAVANALDVRVVSSRALGGGDINLAFEAKLENGRRIFVKTHPRAPRSMFPAEARGLAWLREARALRVPDVLAVSDEGAAGPCFLALELIEPGRRDAAFDEKAYGFLATLEPRYWRLRPAPEEAVRPILRGMGVRVALPDEVVRLAEEVVQRSD